MTYKRTVDPTPTDVVSLANAKLWIRRDDSADDTVIGDIIGGAIAALEDESGVQIGTQTWTLKLCNWEQYIRLLKQPVQSITSITYYDTSNQSQTVNSTNYRLIAPGKGTAVIEFDQSFTFPALYQRSDAITVTFVAGNTTSLAAKRAIRFLISSDNENREGQGVSDAVRRACLQLRGY